jgi:F-type H+-transporting ATPase subunit b
MELTWSTFVLEVINFVVLVWILKRFFYAPVRRVIDQRRRSIDESRAQAEQRRAEAQSLEEQYQARLSQWEQEKRQAREQLESEIAAERARMMGALRADLAKEGEKARVLEQRRVDEFSRRAEEQALAQGGVFAARVLEQTSGPDVQDRLFDMLIKELSKLSAADWGPSRSAVEGPRQTIKVTSAYPITDDQRAELERALAGAGPGTVVCDYQTDAALIAGFRINAGALVLRANLHDELQFFSEAARAKPG